MALHFLKTDGFIQYETFMGILEIVLFGVVLGVVLFIVATPMRMLGVHIYKKGVLQNIKWKRDLGEAICNHQVKLTLVLGVGLPFAVMSWMSA